MARNRKRLNALADYIEKAKYQFNMSESSAYPTCGTAGCIAGHSAVFRPTSGDLQFLEHDDAGHIMHAHMHMERFASFYGLAFKTAEALCLEPKTVDGTELSYSCVSRSMAVAAIRRLAKTGRVYFDVTE